MSITTPKAYPFVETGNLFIMLIGLKIFEFNENGGRK